MEDKTTTRSPVSICIIARDESARLQRLLPAIRDYVAEIIVVDTGSRDNTPEIASKYADKVVLYTECNNPDTGLIEDFSKARNHSFSLATQPWLMWVDADDEVVGIEKLPMLMERYKEKYGNKPGSYQFPYEYANDGDGRCTMRLYRERLMCPPSAFKFINEVHEVCVPIDPFNFVQEKVDDIIIKHNRSDKPAYEPARNLRILRLMHEKSGDTEPRTIYYMGLEYTNLGNFPKGIEFLERYVGLSGWDDERCMALMKLCEIHSMMGNHQLMIDTAWRAIDIKENWGEPYFYLAAGHYSLADKRENQVKNRTLCIQYAKFGLSLPPTETLLFVNPLYRQVEIHRYLNVALAELGRTEEALASVEEALKLVPKDHHLLNNKQTYTVRIEQETAKNAIAKLNKQGIIDQDRYNRITDLLDGKNEDKIAVYPQYDKKQRATALLSPHSQAWAIPNNIEFDGTPVQLTDEQLQASVLMIWKQYLVKNEVMSALLFLTNAPNRVRHTADTERAKQYTEEMISEIQPDIKVDELVATSIHSYEKLTNPLNQLIIPSKTMIYPYGEFILTTSNGAIDGYGTLKKSDILSAPTTRSIISEFRQAGYHIKNAHSIENEIVVEASLMPPTKPSLDIVFWIGDGLEPWTPRSAKINGIGGSETMAIELSKRLAALGHKVRVYAGCGGGEGIYDGVEYITTNKFPGIRCDVLIASRQATILSEDYNIQCKMKLLWCHDIIPSNGKNKFLLEAYRILALSESHRQYMLNAFDIHPYHIITTRNGIDLNRFNKTVPRNRFKAINSSSPDRSWLDLFDCWKEIKKQVPQAELHLYYGFENWEKTARRQGTAGSMAMHKCKTKEMEQHGVVLHGRVNQEMLANEMLSSGVMLYPTNFIESSCITGMEAQAAGLRIITSNLGALKETVGERGVLIDGDATSKEYQSKFIDAAVKAMTNEDNSDRLELQRYAKEHFCLDDLAKDWNKMIYDLLEQSKNFPLVPYQPTIKFSQKKDDNK